MGKRIAAINNPNLGSIRRAVRDLGGEIVGQVGSGMRHLRLMIRTKQGAEFILSVNLGKVDAKKQVDWLRQQMSKADKAANKKVRRS